MENILRKRRGNMAQANMFLTFMIFVAFVGGWYLCTMFGNVGMQNENARLESQVGKLQGTISNLETIIDNDSKQLQSLNEAYDAKEKSYNDLISEYDDLQVDYYKIKDVNVDLKNDLSDLENNLEKMKLERDEALDDLAMLKEVCKSGYTNTDYKKLYLDALDDIKDLKADIKDLKSDKKKLTRQIDALEDEIKKLQDTLDDYVAWFSPKPDAWIEEHGWVPEIESPEATKYYVTTSNYGIDVNGRIRIVHSGACIPEGPTGLVVGLRGYVNENVPGTRVDIIGEAYAKGNGEWIAVIPDSPDIARKVYPGSEYKYNPYDVIIIDPGSLERLQNIRDDLNSGHASNKYLTPYNKVIALVKFERIFTDMQE